MLDPKLIRESPELVRSAIARKHLKVDLDAVLAADAAWRAKLQAVQHHRATQKAANAAMATLAKGSPEFAAKLAEMKAVSAQIKEKEAGLKSSEETVREAMLGLPNIPHESVPEGRTAEENVVHSTNGDVNLVGTHALPHWDVPGFASLFDFDRGSKVTGAGFPFFIGEGARIVRSLINFFIDEDVRAGYVEVSPPIFVNAASATATGQLPDKEGQMYETTPRTGSSRSRRRRCRSPIFTGTRSWTRRRCRSTGAPIRHASPGGGKPREGRARPQPRPPVRQGGATEMGAPDNQL